MARDRIHDDPYSTYVPVGQYQVALHGWEKGTAFGSRRWFGHFRITELGRFLGLPILRFWNEPQGPFLARSHNLYLDYVAVIGNENDHATTIAWRHEDQTVL